MDDKNLIPKYETNELVDIENIYKDIVVFHQLV